MDGAGPDSKSAPASGAPTLAENTAGASRSDEDNEAIRADARAATAKPQTSSLGFLP